MKASLGDGGSMLNWDVWLKLSAGQTRRLFQWAASQRAMIKRTDDASTKV
jgi:hypothetical protein